MKKIFKYGVFPIVVFVFLLIVTVMLMPILINVQRFIPEIEEKISEVAGRSFSIGPDLAISFFPWLSVSFSDLRLGNPPGFLTDDFVKIDSFEARIKLLPLLKKEVQVSRFVVGGLEVNFERNSAGKVNSQLIGKMMNGDFPLMPISDSPIGFLPDGVTFAFLAVTDGRLNWIDRTRYIRHTVDDLMVLLNDVAVDQPTVLDFKASYDGKPVALEGKIGPLWQEEGNESLPIDFDFLLVETLEGRLHGKIENWRSAPAGDFALTLASFSPRKLFDRLGIAFPVETTDPNTFEVAALDVEIRGTGDALAIKKGTAQLDDSRLVFSAQAKNIQKPDLGVFLEIDRLDLDRYLPPENVEEIEVSQADEEPSEKKIHTFLRNAALNGALNLQSLKVHGGSVTDIDVQLSGNDGLFTMDRSSISLYGGQLQANLSADLSGEIPKMRVVMQSEGVRVETMLRDFGVQDILSGSLKSEIALEFSGDTVDAMQKTLSGEVKFTCLDGALLGVDLLRPMQGQKDAEKDQQSPRTDFSELKSVVTLNNGLLNTRETLLTSPAMAMDISGSADIALKHWDLQVVPRILELEHGQKESRRPPMPLTVTGTFAEPELRVDIRKDIAVVEKNENVANLVDEKIPSPVDDDVKDLVGKALIDPAIVVQRFRLQPETIKRSEVKKQLQFGSGKIRINPLQEETSIL
ncbi:MAG: hypothetical protein VR65_18650 [Desulfobulbaceae bacterium BRH_c16a]|nr:MAG: hypothetical protein VR65_18650 [Desulfobulbaceae bacterium BRH_c16a]